MAWNHPMKVFWTYSFHIRIQLTLAVFSTKHQSSNFWSFIGILKMYLDNEDTTIKWLIDSKGRPLVNRQSFAPNYITSGFSLHEWHAWLQKIGWNVRMKAQHISILRCKIQKQWPCSAYDPTVMYVWSYVLPCFPEICWFKCPFEIER